MNPAPQREIMDVLYANEPTSRNFSQNFDYANRTFTHEHHVEVENTPDRKESLEIRNHFATVQADTLFKLTEIHVENRIIKIIDSFSTQPQQITVSESQDRSSESVKTKNRKLQLPKRILTGSLTSSKEVEGKLRDTKNVVKNIIRLF